MKAVPYELVKEVKRYLGKEGKELFNYYLERYGTVNPVFQEEGQLFPHSVHFREGMQIRNFMRSTMFCKDWDSHDFDNQWADIVLTVLKLEKTDEQRREAKT